METTVKQRFKELAHAKGWSLAFAEGYSDGEVCKRRGMSPSKYVLVAGDEYSLGFRAGYFQRACATGTESAAVLVQERSSPDRGLA